MFKKLLSRRSEEPFFLIAVLLLVIIAAYNWVIALLALILLSGAYVLTRKNHDERNKEISQFFDAISRSVDQASTYAVQNLPIGIAIIDMESSLCWANSVFRDWVGDIDNDQKLDHIMPNLNIDKFWGKFGYFFEHIGSRYYRVVYKYLQTEAAEDDNYLILYFEDITETETQKMNCLAAVPVFCDIEIDNMEEVAKGMSAVQQTTLWTNVNNCLVGELTARDCFVRAYGNEKYFACLSRKALNALKDDNFSFLEKIRSIHTVNRIPVTISMGVATLPEDIVAKGLSNFNELADKARAGLDLALGRGGDQAVVFEEDGSPHFYGGKTRSVEKNTRVRARVVAQAIRELIDASDLVLVMGHEREDYDSIGAAVGVAHMARLAGKTVHIVISEQTDAIQRLEDQILDYPIFKDLFITAEAADAICNNQTLLFIVDTHRPDMTVAPALLDKTERRVVIDHHRRSSDFIKKPLLTYTEASSSSTCELVTELLQYYQEDVELEKIEATALYAGIIVDTKNFAVQTGVRTFDAASYLRRCGADPEIVRELFSSDFNTIKNRASILSEAQIKDGIATAICPREIKNSTIVAAQIADILVNIDNVEASFTFYELADNYIGISARSRGEINVQLVMEALGGGGHRTVAGVQLKDRSLAEAKNDVMAALHDVLDKDKEIEKE
ncbi:RNA-binding protein [Megasphaera cerevisiae DSM 20462]|jgi:c-di-AMP phosphodiesterase-like protein|uniref:Cyclic-di-AMP phosphodiesterase n=1 Tax=Megasphaera cerevisiae DSM 20462 TaxID=1122219 RepID=A0A0J6WQT4_9FIRM|nr:DHH family phosphoesterase [Megasphaera cerevisiae]KMO85800.1 RNA-binding protein [Megasphaera cerevisiae DSM 20462]OKY52966.1 RNA-binding protein [Megasphaera cerevisiae]SJZ71065.1 c-di-AMP phosphodiesterase, consists of a GGDEF-like and DHH domains [Megasphaera cerevisiae DSM 20462]